MALSNGSGTPESDGPAPSEAATPKGGNIPRYRPKARKPEKRAKEQSTIGFVYRDLDTAVSVALAMLGAGGVALTAEQLGGVMGLQAGSGNFVSKIATARMFGLVTNNQGKYELTMLGFAIVDSDEKRQKQARADAFLSVPLYKRTYDEFKGKQLPPKPGLEQAFIRFGVAPKQKTAARLAFEKSAQQAGFFAAGMDRLIEPIIGGVPSPDRKPIENPGNGGNEKVDLKAAGISIGGLHPFIQGLLDKLPPPETNWAPEGRAKWLMTANNIFDMLYNGAGEVQILLKPTQEKE